MDKLSDFGGLIMIFVCVLFWYLVTTPYNDTFIHKYLYNKGISQAIQKFENK